MLNFNFRKNLLFRICEIILILLFVVGCEFKPKEIYFVENDKETFGSIDINLLDQPDTIILMQNSVFHYDITIQPGQVIYTTEIRVDDELISTHTSSNGSFTLWPTDFDNGYHQLKIDVYTTSGTGSIADIAGAEALYYTHEWVIVTDLTPPEALEINNIAEFNGRLKIEWTKNSHINFQHYGVYRTLYDPITDAYSETVVTAIFNADSNWCIDSSYVGGLVTYRVANTAMNITAAGIAKSYNGLYPKFKSVIKNGDEVTLVWNKTKFYGNFDKYQILYKDRINMNFSTLFSTGNLIDTLHTPILPFGDSLEIWLKTIPKNVNTWNPETMADRIYVYAGEKIPRHAWMIHSNNPNIVYLIDYYSISRYNIKAGVTEMTIETDYNDWQFKNVCISPSGNYLVRISGDYAYILDPVNLSIEKSIHISEFFNRSDPYQTISVTNNGWLSVSMDEYPFTGGLIDVNVSDTLFTVKGSNLVRIYPSANGKYMIILNGLKQLYQYNGSLTKLHALDSDDYELNSMDEEKLYRYSYTSVSILNCSNMQPLKTYTTDYALGFHIVDPITGFIMVSRPSGYDILDIEQNTVVNTKRTVGYVQTYNFFNNTMFSGFGFKLNLQQ